MTVATVAPPRLAVAEVFGPTFQGEGPSAGQRAVFLRLGGCNLSCGWCDTPYTWDWTGQNGRTYDPRQEVTGMAIVEVATAISALSPPEGARLVVTGGEPLLQAPGLVALGRELRHTVEVETNGTQGPPTALALTVAQWNVSPKLAHSGLRADRRIVPPALAALNATGRATWKFVVRHDDPAHLAHDLAEVDALVETFALDRRAVWLMPEGRTAEAILGGMRRLAQPVLEHGWHLSTRLHVLLWGDERGR